MKKIRNIVVFIVSALFILAGFSKAYRSTLSDAVVTFFKEARGRNVECVDNFEHAVDSSAPNMLRYHSLLMDVYSVKERLLGTMIVNKDDMTLARSREDSLIQPRKLFSEDELRAAAEAVGRVQQSAEANGAKFLYCAAPNKEYYQTPPANVEDHTGENYDTFISILEQLEIPTLDLSETMENMGVPFERLHYYTDHHWLVDCGFESAGAICRELDERYGFDYNGEYADINNYTVTTYKDYFLGSYGKKTGCFFTRHGADDFNLITPKFETSFTEEKPMRSEAQTGSFEEVLLDMSNINEKDYYGLNPYAAYTGGDFRLQIMKNNLLPEGKTALLIRDSYACAAAPFLAMHFSELHICDVRNFSYFVGDRIDVGEYIRELQPDYVIVLYSGVDHDNANGRYDFFGGHK